MQTALSSKRSWIARIAVLAMVASLMAIAAPAGAAIDTSASCPDSIEDAGFTDLAGVPAAAVDAINCIADYGISTGTSATTFDPFADVARWQMALFLTRQAEIHGVTLPDGSDQGFTDLAGVPAAAVTAINQTAQLGISTGTSATTFDPFSDVERWQMALFLTRLITGAGITLPAGADQGFTDLAGVPDAAVTAINQLGELDISDGTTATTYDPFTDVERWAMALFLTRVLAADGITPPVSGDIAVSPTDAATIVAADPDDTTDNRVYTASGLNNDTTYLINLFDPAGIDTSGSSVVVNTLTASTEAQITVVNGAAITAAASASTQPVGGTITFTVDAVTGAFGDVVPVVWVDSDGDTSLDLNASDVPTEPFGIGGVISVFPQEAPAGATVPLASDVSIDGAVKDSNIIVAGGLHWVYDSNDRFYIDDGDNSADPAEQVTLEDFEASLTESGGDDIGVLIYFRADSLVSEFVLTDLEPAPPTLALDSVGETQVTVTVAGLLSGATANVKVVADGAGSAATAVASESTATDQDTTTAGFQVVVDGLTAATLYDVYATQTVGGETSGFSAVLDITTNPDTAPAVTDALANDINDGVGSTNQILVRWDEAVTVLDATGFTVTVGGFTLTGVSATTNAAGTTVIVTLDGTLNDAPNVSDVMYTVDVAAGSVEDAGGTDNLADGDTFLY